MNKYLFTVLATALCVFLLPACAQAQAVVAVDCADGTVDVADLPAVALDPSQASLDVRLTLSIEYDSCGRVVGAKLRKGSGSRTVDAAAQALARTWRFAPDPAGRGSLDVPMHFTGEAITPPLDSGAGLPPPPPPPEPIAPGQPPSGYQLPALPAPLAALPTPYGNFSHPVSALQQVSPRFPDIEAFLGIGGVVLTLVDVDATGKVIDVHIEKSSRNRSLDSAAMEAVRSWRFLPAVVGGRVAASRVRIPVDFDPYEQWATGLKDRKPERSRIASAEARPDGMVAGYAQDPLALGFASIADAAAMLEEDARSMSGPFGSARKYLLEDANGISKWSVCGEGCPGLRFLRRWRLVNDGRYVWWASSMLCESDDPEACRALEARVRAGSPPQRLRALP